MIILDYEISSFKGKKFITIPKLKDLGLKHCFTTSDINLRYGSSDRLNGDPDDFKLICEFLDIDPKQVFFSKQEHSRNFKLINEKNIELLGTDYAIGKIIPDNDGFISNLDDLVLVSRNADCTPILLYDPVKRVHANLHSGWAGSLKKISKYAVEAMVDTFKSNPRDIVAVLGPSIGFEDFEVQKDLVDLFSHKFSPVDSYISKRNDVKYHIDLDWVNIKILLDAGLDRDNIINIDLSTMSEPLFHSYRRDKKDFQLMGLVTAL